MDLSASSVSTSSSDDCRVPVPSFVFAPVRIRPLHYHVPDLQRRVAAPPDIFSYIVEPSFRGLLISRSEGARFLLCLTVSDWNRFGAAAHWVQSCYRQLLPPRLTCFAAMSTDSLPDIMGDDGSVGHVSEDDGPPVLPIAHLELPPFGPSVQSSGPLFVLPRPSDAEDDALDWGDDNSPVSAMEDFLVEGNPGMSELSSEHTSCKSCVRDDLPSQSEEHDASEADPQLSETEKLPVDEPPSKMARTVGDVFADNFVRLADGGMSDVVLPWELPAVSAIFGVSSVFSELKMPTLSMRETGIWTPQSPPCDPFAYLDESEEPFVSGDLASNVFKVLSDVDVDAQQSKAVRLAVDKWIVIMRRNRKMHPECEVDPLALEACIGSRAAGTASKRAGSILTFLRWF